MQAAVESLRVVSSVLACFGFGLYAFGFRVLSVLVFMCVHARGWTALRELGMVVGMGVGVVFEVLGFWCRDAGRGISVHAGGHRES